MNPKPTEIIVIGHFYGKANWQYFQFLNDYFSEAQWTYNYFDTTTKENLERMLNNFRVNVME